MTHGELRFWLSLAGGVIVFFLVLCFGISSSYDTAKEQVDHWQDTANMCESALSEARLDAVEARSIAGVLCYENLAFRYGIEKAFEMRRQENMDCLPDREQLTTWLERNN